MRATKIFKNNEEYILRQFSSIHGYIWCNACYRYALADNCPKHSRSNMIWQLILSTYLMSCYSMTSHQIVLQCSPNYFRCSSNLSSNRSPFGRTYDVLPNRLSVLTRATSYRSCICLWHLRQNTAFSREWAIRQKVIGMNSGNATCSSP